MAKIKIKNKTQQAMPIVLLDETGKEYCRQLAPRELTTEIDEESIAKPTMGLVRNGSILIIK